METMIIDLSPIVGIALEVIAGKWGNGQERIDNLEAAGYNYNEVRDRVNQLMARK